MSLICSTPLQPCDTRITRPEVWQESLSDAANSAGVSASAGAGRIGRTSQAPCVTSSPSTRASRPTGVKQWSATPTRPKITHSVPAARGFPADNRHPHVLLLADRRAAPVRRGTPSVRAEILRKKTNSSACAARLDSFPNIGRRSELRICANFTSRTSTTNPAMQQSIRRCLHQPYAPFDVNDRAGEASGATRQGRRRRPGGLLLPHPGLAQTVVDPPGQFRRHPMLGIPSAPSMPQPS